MLVAIIVSWLYGCEGCVYDGDVMPCGWLYPGGIVDRFLLFCGDPCGFFLCTLGKK